jgi:flavin-dependent dehydrogenase
LTRTIKTDVVVVGGGPAGAASALRLLDEGVSTLIVEREQFPRFHIGESMTGECGNLVRELGFADAMTEARHPTKPGVVVFGPRGNPDWWIPMMRRDPDLALVSNPAWQVRRSTFDAMLLDAATSKGADRLDGRAVAPLVGERGEITGVEVADADGGQVRVEAKLTLDCSGQATFLANRKVTGPKYSGSYDKQIAIFSHVKNYARDPDTDEVNVQSTNTHIFYSSKYHWAWAIPIDDEVTSVGIVVPAATFRERKQSKHDFYDSALHDMHPGLAERVDGVERVEDVHVIPNYSFQVRGFAGPGFMCVGDAHRFIDPIFSFGLYVALQESKLAVNAAVEHLGGRHNGGLRPFHDYMVGIEKGIDVLEDMIDMFWENPIAFAVMVHARYRDPLIDVFSGRIYEDQINKGVPVALAAFRKVLKRERVYDDDGLYSVPIGSRYHADRAPLWNAELDSVETTERWLRDNP